jgi:hypothetical protein
MKTDFNINYDEVVQEPVLYGDFVANTAEKSYQQLDDLKLVKIYFVFFQFEMFVLFR